MIWYPVKAFAAKGYTVPKTWDELVALADKIVADGSHPFCVSAGGPGTATGWELTDWVEEVLLKTEDPQVTNDWISHKITFTDPKIKAAFDKVGSLLFKDGYVDGGGQAIVNADLKTVMDPMFNQDTAAPGCWMQKIPVWYGPDFFPDKRTSGGDSKYMIGDDGDIGIMPFPTITDTFKGAEGSADSFMVLNDRPEVRALRGVPGDAGGPRGLDQERRRPLAERQGAGRVVRRQLQAEGRERDRQRRDGHRLRRLRPDAPVRRPGQLLDRHLRLGQHQRLEHRCRAAGHRRQLAQVSGTIVT